jgi:hypothetical protein
MWLSWVLNELIYATHSEEYLLFKCLLQWAIKGCQVLSGLCTLLSPNPHLLCTTLGLQQCVGSPVSHMLAHLLYLFSSAFKRPCFTVENFEERGIRRRNWNHHHYSNSLLWNNQPLLEVFECGTWTLETTWNSLSPRDPISKVSEIIPTT